MALTFVILAITILFFIFGRLRSDLVALLSLLALFLAGILSLDQVLAGFGNATVIMIAALFVVGDGLSRTGVTAWLGERMLAIAESSKLRLLVILMAGTALLSAFISNTGTVATLMPAVTSAAWYIGSMPSKFLMPLAFAANTGGLLTLTGTPPNIIINEILIGSGFNGFGYFEFSLIGLPLLMVSVVYMVVIGRRLLPSRKETERPAALTESMSELARDYTLDGNLFWLRVRYGSTLINKTLAQARLGQDYDITVLNIQHAETKRNEKIITSGKQRRRVAARFERIQLDHPSAVPDAETMIGAGDILLVKASQSAVSKAMLRFNLGVQSAEETSEQLPDLLLSHEVGVAEVLIAPRSAYIGRTITHGQLAQKYNVQVLSIRRQDRQLENRSVRLQFGDALLVRGRWQDIDRLKNETRNFVVVGSPETMARQIVELSPSAVVAALALIGMILLMVTGAVPTVIAAIAAAIVMVLGGCLSMEQAYRSISWSSLVLIAAMIPMSTALQVTGGAELLSNGLVNSLGSVGSLALLAGIFLLTTTFSQVINNSATTILVAPIVLQAAFDLGVSPYPLLMMVAISASTAFLTPIGTTTNLMVTIPGGYTFNDFIKIGLPLIILSLVLSLLLVPMIWPL